MKIYFTFRSDEYELPNALDLFELVRAIYQSFVDNPLQTFTMLERNIVTMGQLRNGLYISFREHPQLVCNKFANKDKAENVKLEMNWPIPGMVRVEVTNISKWLITDKRPFSEATLPSYNLGTMFPFRVSSDQTVEQTSVE